MPRDGRSAASDRHVEFTEIHGAVRRYTVLRRRVRYPDLPLTRLSVALEISELSEVLAALPDVEQRAAKLLLKQGLGRWRRWTTVLRRPTQGLDPRLAERELMPHLLNAGALQLRERYDQRDDAWRLDAFRSADVHAEALGRSDPERLTTTLDAELAHDAPRAALQNGKPAHLSWEAFAFVLRAAEKYLDLADHGTRPHDRELAALVWHSKAFTERRAELVADIVGVPLADLFEPRPRQLRADGTLIHPDVTIWADAVDDLPLEPPDDLIGVLCVENSRTFEALRPYARRGWFILEIPGQAPTAEVVLLSRIAALASTTPVFAAFDPDPAGVEIALSLAQRANVALDPRLMDAEALRRARPLRLKPEDYKTLARLAKRPLGAYAALVDEINDTNGKGEQESIHRWLRERLDALTESLGQPAHG